MKPGEVKLSVSLITYNQKKYIEQAIKGVLEQKTNFNYELIIGDDFSADGTRDILTDYQKKYPELIRLILHPEKNRGIPGALNFLSILNAARGKYIALLDGDDYWCDSNKLQKQVDFLEKNPDYAICCHRVYVKKNSQRPKLNADEYAPSAEATYDIEMMAKEGNLIATPSAVYRNKLFSSFPAWYEQSPVGDYALHMINAQYGKIKYLPDAMAVYRDHSKGAWGGQSVMTNAWNMIKVVGLLLTEPFDEPVKKGLGEQLQKNKTLYLSELVHKDWDRFCKEFNSMMDDDRTIALALIKKMKMDRDELYRSGTYRILQKLKKIRVLFGD